MLNTIIIVGICLVFIRCLGIPVEIWVLRLLVRGLAGALVLYICNYFLLQIHENWIVNINEITLTVSAFLGMPGVLFLYLLRWFLLIHP